MADFMQHALGDEDFNETLNRLEDSDSNEEHRGGSRAGRSARNDCGHEEGASRLFSS